MSSSRTALIRVSWRALLDSHSVISTAMSFMVISSSLRYSAGPMRDRQQCNIARNNRRIGRGDQTSRKGLTLVVNSVATASRSS